MNKEHSRRNQMSNYDPYNSIRLLKGPSLHCFVALLYKQDAVGVGWLARKIGYSERTVASVLRFLQDQDMVICNGRYESWQINMNTPHFSLITSPFLPGASGKNCDSNATTTTISKHKDKEREEAVVEESLRKDFPDSHRLLKFAGVGEPMATNLAKRAHVTPCFLAGHYLKAKAEMIPVALMIHRIKSEDPAPELNRNYHLLGCTCLDCGHLCFSPNQGILEKGKFRVRDFLKKTNS